MPEEKNKKKEVKSSFLDEFYKLSSNDIKIRSKASESIIQHCFYKTNSTSTTNNIEDKYYTIKRLYKGILSNRLSSKQGFSSCLVSFLKNITKEKDYNIDWLLKNNDSNSTTLEECLYDLYMKETTPKKGENERDYIYSKLFLFNIFIKSGIIFNNDTILEVQMKYLKDMIQVYSTKKDYDITFKEGIISAFILLLENCVDGKNKEDIYTLIQEEILFNKDNDNKNDWNMNELTLGMYLYRTVSIGDNKRLHVFNPNEYNNLQKWKDTILNHISATTTTSENDTTQQHHIFWDEVKYYLLKEDKDSEKTTLTLKFIMKDILQNVAIKKSDVTFGVYILQEFLPLCSSALTEEILTKDIMIHLCMNVLISTNNNKKRKKNNKQDNNAMISIWKDIIFNKCTIQQCYTIYKIMTKYIPSVLSNNIVKINLWNKLSIEYRKEYIVFVQSLITSSFKNDEKKIDDDSNSTESYCSTWMDILYRIPNTLLQKNNNDATTMDEDELIQTYKNIILFFMSIAFQKEDQDETQTAIPRNIKKLSSSRFYSLLTDTIQQMFNYNQQKQQNKKQHQLMLSKQVSIIYSILNSIFEEFFKDKESYYDSMYNEYQGSKLNDIFGVISNINSLLQKHNKKKENEKIVIIEASMNLIYFLFFQLFHIVSSTSTNQDNDDDIDEDDDALEELDVLISDINHILHKLLNIPSTIKEDNDEEEETNNNPLSLLMDVCVTILSFYNDKHSNNNKDKGSTIKLLQRVVKISFKSILKYCSDNSATTIDYKIDTNVITILLESICIEYFTNQPKENDMEEDDDESDNDDSSSDDSDSEDENVFLTAAGMKDLDLENMEVDDDSSSNTTASSSINEEQLQKKDKSNNKKQKKDDDDEEIMIDADGLQDHLLNSDDDNDEMVLEHDEKADPSLVKLIKLRQQQRKKAIQEKISIQLSHQLRCTSLLEVCFDAQKTKIITNDVIYMSIITFLVQRRLLEKALHKEKNNNSDTSSTSSSDNNNNIKEKQLLLDKIDNLLINNICKIKLQSCATSDTTITNEIYIDILQSILNEANQSNTTLNSNHTKYCSMCFLYIIKYIWNNNSVKNDDISKEIINICDTFVTDWYTTRNTNIHTSFFFDFTTRNLHLARILYTSSMIDATTNGRTSFIKSEAFQLVSILYTTKQKQDDGNNDTLFKESMKVLESNISNLALSLQSTYKSNDNDNEMLKAKRLNDVLKANSTLIQFVTSNSDIITSETESFWDIMKTLITLLQSIQLQSTSASIKNKCGKIVQSIQDGLSSSKKENKKKENKKKDTKKDKDIKKVDKTKKTKKVNKKDNNEEGDNKKKEIKDDTHAVVKETRRRSKRHKA